MRSGGEVRTIRAEWKYTYMYLVTNDSLPVYRGVCVCVCVCVHVCVRVCVCDVSMDQCVYLFQCVPKFIRR